MGNVVLEDCQSRGLSPIFQNALCWCVFCFLPRQVAPLHQSASWAFIGLGELLPPRVEASRGSDHRGFVLVQFTELRTDEAFSGKENWGGHHLVLLTKDDTD